MQTELNFYEENNILEEGLEKCREKKKKEVKKYEL
jgi:hypothetical protein